MVAVILAGMFAGGQSLEAQVRALFATLDGGLYRFGPDTCFQDVSGTILCSVGDPIGYLADLSGRGHPMKQATSTARPILRKEGGFYYAEFDAVDDFLASDTNLSIGPACYFAIAGRKTSGAAKGMLMCGADILNRFGLRGITSSARYAGYARVASTVYSQQVSSIDTMQDNTDHVVDARILTGTTDLRADNVPNTSGSNTVVDQALSGRLGFADSGSNGSCEMTRVYGGIALAGDISDADRIKVHTYLGNMMGLIL